MSTDSIGTSENNTASISRVSRVLRYLGAALLVGSAIAFSFQGWEHWDSLTRHFAFLGFVSSLSFLGILSGVGFKEDKGARTFLGVSVLMMPSVFAQVAAMIFAHYQYQSDFPDFLRYSAPSVMSVSITAFVTVLLSTALSFAAFSVFLRKHAKLLTGLFLVANLSILIPVRAEEGVVFISLLLSGLLLYYDRKVISKTSDALTWEGYAARSMLHTPLVLILGRTFFLYSFEGFGPACVCAIITTFSLMYCQGRDHSTGLRAQRYIATAFSSLTWIYFMQGVLSSLGVSSWRMRYLDLEALLYGIPVAVVVYALSYLFSPHGKSYRKLASILGGYSAIYFVFSHESIFASFICSVVGVCLVVGASAHQERGSLYCGIVAFVIGLVAQCVYAIEQLSLSPWISLGLAGVVVVFLAIYLERKGLGFLERMRKRKEVVATWS